PGAGGHLVGPRVLLGRGDRPSRRRTELRRGGLARPGRGHAHRRRRRRRRGQARRARRGRRAAPPERARAAVRRGHRRRHRRDPRLHGAGTGTMSVDFPILSAIVVVPVVGALVCSLLPTSRPEIAKAAGYAFTMATAGLTGYMLYEFAPHHAGFQFVEAQSWI